MTNPLPSLFISHGSPMNALSNGPWQQHLKALANELSTPRAILCISAHWYTDGSYVTGDFRPPTLHDFSGFPPALNQINYPAPGDVGLAQQVSCLLDVARGGPRNDWGLDHGTWSVLLHMYPKANIPVLQLAIDRTLPAAAHIALGRALAPLRQQGILILGSGGATHNLPDGIRRMQRDDTTTPEWATRFDTALANAVLHPDDAKLLSLWPDHADAKIAHPIPDHLYPLHYAYGAATPGGTVRFPFIGFQHGSFSMRSVCFE